MCKSISVDFRQADCRLRLQASRAAHMHANEYALQRGLYTHSGGWPRLDIERVQNRPMRVHLFRYMYIACCIHQLQ